MNIGFTSVQQDTEDNCMPRSQKNRIPWSFQSVLEATKQRAAAVIIDLLLFCICLHAFLNI